MRHMLAVLALPAAIALGGCSGDDGGGGDDGTPFLPGIPTIRFVLDGGDAPVGSAWIGGDAGSLSLNADGQFIPDDGRTRPVLPAGEDAFSGLLADNLVTYTELAGVVAPNTANPLEHYFNFPAGLGLTLPAGATLDLTNGAPGTVDTIFINVQDRPILLRGTIRAGRSAGSSLALSFETQVASSPAAFEFSGHFDGDGAQGFDGGSLTLSSQGAGSDCMFLGSGNARGGQVLTVGMVTDVGNGGSISAAVAGGDLLTYVFGVQAHGGDSGDDSAGDGGSLSLQTASGFGMAVAWGLHANGGAAPADIGGTGGNLVVRWFAGAATLFCRAILNGGAGDGGGTGGTADIGAYTTVPSLELFDGCALQGTAWVTAHGGAGNALGGAVQASRIAAETVSSANIMLETRGGNTSTGAGGAATTSNVLLACVIQDSSISFSGGSGNGSTTSASADAYLELMTPAAGSALTAIGISNTNISVNMDGGSASAGLGGKGGGLWLESTSALACTFTNAVAVVRARGGNGAGTGGVGGEVILSVRNAAGSLRLNADLVGGQAASAGGTGGAGDEIRLELGQGSLSLQLDACNVNGAGGNATGAGAGGAAGNLSVDLNSDSNSSEASLALSGTLDLRGGDGGPTGNGGMAGTMTVSGHGGATAPGSFTLAGSVLARGGSGIAGGGSGTGHAVYLLGDATISGVLESRGGNGAMAASGGQIAIAPDGDVLVSGRLSSLGGSGAAGGSGGDILLGDTSSATLTLTATAVVQANGGATGGNAGQVELNPAGTGGATNPNLIEQAGSTVQTLDGSGASQPNITRD